MAANFKHLLVSDASRIRDSDAAVFPEIDNPVHFVWSYENFRYQDFFSVNNATAIDAPGERMPYYIYERWIPALRLASLLLDRARPFLERVMFAPVVTDSNGVPSLWEEWKPNPVSSLTFETELRDLSRTYRIYRCPSEHPSQPGHSFCGATDIVPKSHQRSTLIYSAVQDIFFDTVGRFYFDQCPVEDQENIFLMLAITLVHELAHAINFQRYLDCINLRGISTLPIGIFEPAYDRKDLLRGLGLRLEFELFGGEIQFPLASSANGNIAPATDGSKDLQIKLYDHHTGDLSHPYRLAPATVRSLFQRQSFVSFEGRQKLMILYLLPCTDNLRQVSTRKVSAQR